ncbi:MAG TPA: hypothetical protein VMZ92_10735 [Planctomycetota bacterium]|nr:hypothetical protein [Planctomycetota bacterium]
MRITYRHILLIAIICGVLALVGCVIGLVRPTSGPARIVIPLSLMLTGLLALFVGAALRVLTERVDKLESGQQNKDNID